MMEECIVIIAGGRNFDNYRTLRDKCNIFLSNKANVVVLCGGAKGADYLGRLYAKEKGYEVREYLAEWKKYGKSAGPKRNAKMVSDATHLIAFWDGNSKGTADVISQARDANLNVRVVMY